MIVLRRQGHRTLIGSIKKLKTQIRLAVPLLHINSPITSLLQTPTQLREHKTN